MVWALVQQASWLFPYTQPTPCEQLSQCTPQVSLKLPPGSCPTCWVPHLDSHVFPEASEVCRGADRVLPPGVDQNRWRCFPRVHRERKAQASYTGKQNHHQTSKIPRGQKEVLCCPLSDRIESPNHKYPKKNKGRNGERKRDG